jgi:flagellar basal-body rod protein FlgF
MDRLIFNAVGTIREHSVGRQVLVNEMANVSTIGFKTSFDVALRSIKVEGEGFDTRYQAQAISRDLVRMTPGTLMLTGKKTDIAMNGATVLAVQAKNGELAFTRRGDLTVTPQGQIENGSGHLVMGQNGPIAAPPGFEITINPDGSIYARDPAAPATVAATEIDRLRILDASQVDLSRRPDGLFQVDGKPPGTAFESGPAVPSVTPQALEGSNVSPIETMTRLIDQARSFEVQVNILKETKSLDESGSTMMKMA